MPACPEVQHSPDTPLRVLIAGCGYVGIALGKALATSGHQVWGMRRNTSALPPEIRPLQADLGQDIQDAVRSQAWDVVYYTASSSAYTPEAYEAAYVTQVTRLLHALEDLEQPPKRFIYTSSTGLYTQQDGEWLDEDSPVQPTRFAAQALLEGEQRVHQATLPGVVVRLAGIYGPGRTRLLDQAISGEAQCIEERVAWLNLIHREDCAGILAHLATYPNPASCYLAVDHCPVEKNTLLRWLAAELGLPDPPVIPVEEAPPLRRGGNRRYRNRRILETGYHFRYPTYREGYAALLATHRKSRDPHAS